MTNFVSYFIKPKLFQMSEKLKIAIYQMDIVWCDAEANLDNARQWVVSLPEDVDIAVLPEMFTTGFMTEPRECREQIKIDAIAKLVEMAKNTGKAIVCSIIFEENKRYYNRALFVEPSGKVSQYDKRHLFRMSGEHEQYAVGSKRIVVDYKGFRIMLLVCYDLRFPVWSRNQDDYDVAIYVASWPQSRIRIWDRLLRARAIENMCYVIGANRVGNDPNIIYNGNSLIVNYFGDDIYTKGSSDNTLIAELNLEELKNFRQKFPAQLDADKFKILDL